MIQLRERDRAAIIQIAESVLPQGVEVWVYGSRIKGRSHEASDLDLIIKAPKGGLLSSEALTAFRCALQNSVLPILVQVLDCDMVPDYFKEGIEADHVLLLKVGG